MEFVKKNIVNILTWELLRKSVLSGQNAIAVESIHRIMR